MAPSRAPFILRAFAAFYLALAIGALVLYQAETVAPTLRYIQAGMGLIVQAGMGLIVPITAAAFVYIGRFDYSDHLGQAAYIVAYLLVAVAAIVVLAWAHRRPLADA